MLRKISLFVLVAAINIAAGLAAVLAYFAYGKLSSPNYFCGSFGRIDAEIGWTIAPNASSCIGGREAFSSAPPWFEGKVYSDANGFRSAAAGGPTPTGGVLAVGDSWTFGFGVTFEDSYPGRLQQATGMPVVVAASPAYGSAQAIMLAERWVDRLKPRAIVYLDLGFWDRSACSGAQRPSFILKPCYWQARGAEAAELVAPPPGRVQSFASWGVYPGGMLGAGEDSWTYFLVSRPVALALQIMTRIGLVPGFGHDFRAVGVEPAAIQRGALDHLARLATQARVPVLLLDPQDIYREHFAALPPERRSGLIRIGADVWQPEVEAPAAKLPPAQAAVPHDGHFGPGKNALVAALIEKELKARGLTK